MRDAGLTPIGSALTAIYLTIVIGPILEFSDWYYDHFVNESGFKFPDDFDGNVEFIEDSPFGKFDDRDPIHCPPIGSLEWDEWINKKV